MYVYFHNCILLCLHICILEYLFLRWCLTASNSNNFKDINSAKLFVPGPKPGLNLKKWELVENRISSPLQTAGFPWKAPSTNAQGMGWSILSLKTCLWDSWSEDRGKIKHTKPLGRTYNWRHFSLKIQWFWANQIPHATMTGRAYTTFVLIFESQFLKPSSTVNPL